MELETQGDIVCNELFTLFFLSSLSLIVSVSVLLSGSKDPWFVLRFVQTQDSADQ